MVLKLRQENKYCLASIIEAASREIKWTWKETAFSFPKGCNIDVCVWEEQIGLKIKLQKVYIDKKVNKQFMKKTLKICNSL